MATGSEILDILRRVGQSAADGIPGELWGEIPEVRDAPPELRRFFELGWILGIGSAIDRIADEIENPSQPTGGTDFEDVPFPGMEER